MLSASEIILEYVCPLLGIITANVMFSAPLRAANAAVEKGHLGDLNPTPWAFMLGNTVGWITYSFLIQNLFVFFANAPGFVISVWLNMGAAKLQYEQFRATSMRSSLTLFLEQHKNDDDDEDDSKKRRGAREWGKVLWDVTTQSAKAPAPHENIVLAIVTIWVATIAAIAFGKSFAADTKELIVGSVVNLNLVFFYGAPLSTIFSVLKTRSSSSIHVWTMITNTLNGSFWTAYGLAVTDPFIYVPNGLGAVLGVIQMVLCVLFPRSESRSTTYGSKNPTKRNESPTDDSQETGRHAKVEFEPGDKQSCSEEDI